jgi:hypothetical protein
MCDSRCVAGRGRSRCVCWRGGGRRARVAGLDADLVLAPLRRRVLAVLIDLSALLGGLVSIVLSFVLIRKVGVLKRLSKSRPPRAAGERVRERFPGRDRVSVGAALSSTRGKLGMQLFALTVAVLTRNTRGLGFRLLGLRRVEVRDGGPVGVRAAIVFGVVQNARKAVLDRAFAPLKHRTDARRRELADLAPEVARLRREHGDDREALERATMRLYSEHGVNPLSSCAWLLPRLLAAYATDIPGLCGARRQGMADQLAGTVVISEQ